MTEYVYDSGALIAAERGDFRMRRVHENALIKGAPLIVPSPVLAQVWRDGRRQARLHHYLAGAREVPFTPEQARWAGELLAQTGASDIVDACVVVEALERKAAIVTSDPDDIKALLPHDTKLHVLRV